MTNFDGWDFVVLVTILVISALIGVYYRYTGGKQKTTKEYLMADQSMSPAPVAFSLMASFMSAITLMGVSSESYCFGTMFCVINISYYLATPIAAYLFLPVFYRMRTTSVYEYLERRFGRATRLAASIAFSVQMILYMGVVLYAPALALEAVTGITKEKAILIIGLVCTFYSTIGGLKAVLITDVFQSLLMFAAIYSVIVVAWIKADGFGPIWETARERGRLEIDVFSLDPTVRHTWWGLIIGGLITYLSLYGVNQTQVQRLLSVRDLKGAQAALWWNLPILSLLSFSTLFSGLCIFWLYRDCDPVLAKRITKYDQLMPLFSVDTMGHYPGLCGLLVSGIFSGSLSSISSAVSSLSAVTLEDYLKPFYKKVFKRSLAESNTTLISKIIACLYGILCIGLAYMAGSLGSVLQLSLTIFAVVGGPLFAVFTLGMCTTRANQRGVLLGLLLGLMFAFWVGFGNPKPKPVTLPFSTAGCPNPNATITIAAQALQLISEDISEASILTSTTAVPSVVPKTNYFYLYRLSYMWFSVLGFLITATCGYAFSWLLERFKWADNSRIYLDGTGKQIDYALFVPPLARKLRVEANDTEMDELQAMN